MSRTAEPEFVGRTIGDYVVEAKLGEGAMGIVYRARRTRDGMRVALKLLRAELGSNPLFAQRFLREAQIAGEVQHERLVPVIEAGQVDQTHFLAMAFIEGESLEKRLRASALTTREALLVVADVAAGLDALHARKLIHRDVKPSNVLLDTQGRALLTDFGLARGPAHTLLTKPGQLIGTPHYLAPEIIQGEAATPASDVYSLGCLAYAVLCGSPPFNDPNVFQVTIAHLEDEPPDLATSVADVSPSVAEAARSALVKDPARRPNTARTYALSLWSAAEPSLPKS